MEFSQAFRTRPFAEGSQLPLLISLVCASTGLADLMVAILGARTTINAQLIKHGALLFRGLPLENAAHFDAFANAISDYTIDYNERSSPRQRVLNKIYTSTDYSPSQPIFPHNELSYSVVYPLKLLFCCLKPATRGGQTPLIDIRKVTQNISPEVKEHFQKKNWMYVRNFNDGLGLSWQTAFQTSDKSVVESYCSDKKLQFEWRPGNKLRTWQVRPAFVRHPLTTELLWFNHATFFNISTMDREIRDVLTNECNEQDLPNNTYYGDGTTIEEFVLEELRLAYLNQLTEFTWQKGDLLLLDNVLVGHARTPFTGPRTVLVAMADPITRTDVL
jgi:alpha-ketoglutarate-dependent taurine dioxygenase